MIECNVMYLMKNPNEESKAQNTPMVTRQVKNRKYQIRAEKVKQDLSMKNRNCPYREAIGGLLYLSGTTRPDIVYAVNFISQENKLILHRTIG